MNGFESIIKVKVKDSARLFYTLLEYCEGEALSLVQDFRILPPDSGYKEAISALKTHYGQPHIVSRALINSLKNYPINKFYTIFNFFSFFSIIVI